MSRARLIWKSASPDGSCGLVVLTLCGSESYVHAGIVVPDIEVGFDWLLHV